MKAIKRDYVYVSDCYNVQTTMKLLEQWTYNYNHRAPHSSLGIHSPVE